MRNTLRPTGTGRSAGASTFGISRREKVKIAIIYSAILTATVIAFIAAFLVGRVYPKLAAWGLVCYAFGLRHGVDADHIAAIDNTTRKLMQDGKRPSTVGTWFSLGHSVIVFVMIIGLVVATRAIESQLTGGSIEGVGAVLGLMVSGTFLIIIGLVNVLIVLGVYRVFVAVQDGKGKLHPNEVEDLLDKRGGLLNRVLRGLYRLVKEPHYMFPIGVLFGLGFDTATEVALIAISVTVGVSTSVPLWMILILPSLFTSGMVFVDTSDGVAMRVAYGWAFINPLRKIYYNLTVTIVSVAVAFGIGGIELLQLVATQLNLSGPFWGWLNNISLEYLGFVIIGLFLVAWAVSVGYWKYKRYDERFALSR